LRGRSEAILGIAPCMRRRVFMPGAGVDPGVLALA
jgi:hypothetical protein